METKKTDPVSPPQRPIFCPKVLPIPPQKSKSSFDLLSLHNNSSVSNKDLECPVLTPPPLTPLSRSSSAVAQSILSEKNPTVTLPPKTLSLSLSQNYGFQSSMTNLSSNSPTKTQPRTNPYFQSPKSPKTEFGPFSSHLKPQPPPIPQNSPIKPFQSSLNLSKTLEPNPCPPPVPKNHPTRPFQSTLNLNIVPDYDKAPVFIQPQQEKPATLTKSMSHQSIHVMLSKGLKANPFTSTVSKSMNPFLATTKTTSLPQVTKNWTNPFRAPLSSFPAEDPSDTSRLLGIQLFTELLANSCQSVAKSVAKSVANSCHSVDKSVNNSCQSVTTNSNVDVVTNIVSDPLTAPIVSTTLHPMNRKSSSGSVTAVTANSGSQQPPAAGGQSQPSAMGQLAAAPAGGLSGSDKYSALAELDDLFRSTTIDSPAAAPPAPTAASQQELGAAVFSSGAKPAVPSAIPSMFMTESPMNQNGTSWGVAAAGTPPAAPWAAGRAASPAAWGGTTAAAPPPSAGKTSPIWAPQWGQPSQDINNLSTGTE